MLFYLLCFLLCVFVDVLFFWSEDIVCLIESSSFCGIVDEDESRIVLFHCTTAGWCIDEAIELYVC